MKIIISFFLIISNVVFSQELLKHEVYFDTDKYEVPEIEQHRLLLFVKNLDSVKVEKIEIFGFCDDIGSNAYNLNLSQQRANAIRGLLSNLKINDSTINNVNGKEEILLKIINSSNTDLIRSLNRKVEVIVFLKPSQIEPIVETKKIKKKLDDNNLKVGDKIVLENILFQIGYRTIIPESKKTLEEIANILLERKNVYFSIQGHVCCTKNSRDAVDVETKKQNLSLVRAKYIYNYLANKGVSKKRMKYVGMRRKFPLGGDPKFDRRVEILITYISNKNK